MRVVGGRLLEEIISEIVHHATLVLNGVITLNEIVHKFHVYDYSKLNDLYSELNKLEKEGDEFKRKLMNTLKASHIHPEDREDFLRLVLSMDEILGLSKAVAKKFMIFKHLSLDIPSNIHLYITNILEKSVDAAKYVKELISALRSDPSRSLELAEKIEDLEEDVDELRLATLEELYKHCISKYEMICISLPVIIDDAESITDKCEEVADIYRLHLVSR